MLEEIISSKPKRKLLTIFLTRSYDKFYLRELQRLTGEPIRAIQRELPKLEKIGLLKSELDGQRKNYFVDRKCSIYEDLKKIVLKTAAIGDQIRPLIKNTRDIRYAFIYGSTARDEEDLKSDIDLMIIGDIDEIKINNIIRQIESKINRTINYNLMDLREFKKKIKEKNSFLKRILKERKIDLIGSADEI